MSLLPPSYAQRHGHAVKVELAADRQIRVRNKVTYRLAHWPIWIWVFFIFPGPITADLFAHGADVRMFAWLAVVLTATGVAGLFGRLPGVEPAPYILRFSEDRPNPLYRRICYTFAWSDAVVFAVLNAAACTDAIIHGVWRTRQIYDQWYFPLALLMIALGAIGALPRVRASTKGEGHERRYFYGSIWAVCIAQPVLWLLWKILPHSRTSDAVKLAVFLSILAYVGNLARRGLLPRTRPILPGEIAVSD
jgi:cation transport ATPase